MEDQKIVELFQARDERAVPMTMEKYAGLCRDIAISIVSDPQVAEECLNAVCDTIRITLPDKGTRDLPVYLARVTRSVSLNHWKQLPASLRRETQVHSVTEELNRCVAPVREGSPALDRKLLTCDLDKFLSGLDDENRTIFMGRYWYFHTTQQIAADHHMTLDAIEASLIRSRGLLKQTLSYPLKAGNILSCLGNVSRKFILATKPQLSSPVRRSHRKKIDPKKLITIGIVAVLLIGALAAAWRSGLFSKDKVSPDGLKKDPPKTGIELENDTIATHTDSGTTIDVGSSTTYVLAAACDKEQIYILVKSVPGTNDLFLIPQALDRNDSTGLLSGLNGIPEGTIEQYASYLGRRLAKLTFTYAVNGTPLEGSAEYTCGPDGILYYSFTAPIPEAGTEQILISGSFYQDLEEATDAQTADLMIRLTQMPDVKETTVTAFATAVNDDSQLQMHSAIIEKTGLGYNVTFVTELADDRELLFLLTDSNGDPFPALPGHAEAVIEKTAEGYRTFRVSCQLPEDNGDIFFTVTDQDTGIEYGPYDIK